MSDADLARRVEEAGLNGWPTLAQVLYDGWLLRFARGHTRRANSVNPIGPGTRDPAAKIAACETLYRAQGLAPVFRIRSTLDPALDALLAARGYAVEDPTSVRHARLDAAVAAEAAGVELAPAPSQEWLASFAAFTGLGDSQRRTHGEILAALRVPAAFALVRDEGRPAAVGYTALHDGIICLNSVATHPEHRRRGLGRRMTAALLGWGQGQGADGACLAVVAANAPAIALYEGMGFGTELYRYHYRRAPD